MEKSTLKSYNDLFKTTDGNTAKFYVLYNTNLTYLLSSNEIVTFYQIVHVCNIGRNYASLNYLARLLNQSNKTVQKSINKLLLLNLITREKNYSGAYYYTLNLEVIKEIYDKLNSCFKLEDRERFCVEYIASCTESSDNVSMEKFTTPMEKNSTPMENFTTGMEKITTPPMEKFTTHISNIDIKEDDLNKKDEFNKENKFHNKDVEVGEVANADVTNEMANANSSFNNFDSSTNVDKESVSTGDVIEDMFPEKTKDKKEQANANNSSRVADANSFFNIDLNKYSKNNSNKTVVSIENKKECNSSIKEKSFNREPENNVSVDVIDKEKSSSNDVVTIDETALAKDYYQRVVYAESLEELESLSTKIKQLPMKESYIGELLQLIETTSEQFNEDSDDASEFDLNESLNNNPIFARVYNTVLASLSRNSLATLLSFKEQLKNGIDELSTEEAVELQNLVEDCIMKLQAGYSNVA
jgi:predicted transcriptional regulator|nr:MAG TPA: Replication initiator A family protein [Caudoviricetes sp.]